MSPAAEAPAAGADTAVSKPSQLFKSCWSCRVLSGGALVLSAAYVFNAARRVMLKGGPTSMGTVAQITFAASLAAWGVVVIIDPVGKAKQKTHRVSGNS
ncbi:distal membrane-arm assembly complex protein 1 [Morone saxatilis]|uniref:distal membrane-arm assembly complex protein 1 n=1 Tax=Morone saxatilis TaxID=34816 RepID=UPI0015E1DD0C|nr:distal membrane-arm assembly complex protein 1 [Morone saxatilis]